MLTIHYTADRKALLGNAETAEDRAAIEGHYADYIFYLSNRGVEIDYDSDQTTYCWSGADEWPSDLQDFWSWYN